jgi:hypothetical protein
MTKIQIIIKPNYGVPKQQRGKYREREGDRNIHDVRLDKRSVAHEKS